MLQDLSAATPVDSQTLIDGEFTVPSETDIYRIDVTEATDLFIDVVTSDDVNAGWVRVVDQFGASLGNSNRMRDNNFILPAAGRYYILVEGTYNNTGLDSYQLFVTPPTITTTDLNFGLNQGEIAVQAGEVEYDFTLAERATLFMLPTTESNSIHWSIVSDLGEVYQATDFSDGVRVIELEAGDYKMVVDGEGDAVGSFQFTVIVGNDTSDLALNGSASRAVLNQDAPVTAFRFAGIAGQHFSLVPDLDFVFTDSATASETAGNYATSADPEDGYSGIDVALRADAFRDGAAINYIVVTDEDRDNQDDNVTFESMFGGLSGQSALLNVVVASQFRDENNNRAIGVDYSGNAYLADGSGGFTVSAGGFATTNNVSIRNDYIDLAWALNGASWDLGLLRAGGVSAESFTNAFIDVKVEEILKQTALRLFPSNPAVDFEWVDPDDGTYFEPVGGQTYDFDIRIGNNGQPIAYDLLFSQGQAIGSIPVFIISPYEYGAAAVDPDGDQLTWSLVQAPDGMVIDADTGVLAWTADGVSFGEHQITIRVDDGRGGFDQQTFLLDVNGGEPATISGTIVDVDTINDVTVGAVVVGSSDPWLAGMPDGSTASGSDIAPDHSPVLVEDLDFIPGTTMTFSATGWSSFAGVNADNQTPDGTTPTTHGSGAENGISDYKVPIDALVGVFLTDALPTEMPAPDALNFIDADGVPGGINYTALAPELQQVFFIGDGVNDDGVRQEITIPEGATRLFLGTSDGFGWYNNIGFFEVEITAPVYAPVPEGEFTVFLDQNRNGLRDPNEKFTTTDAQGNYSFDSLAAGSYVVRTEAVAGYRPFSPTVPVQEISVAPGEAVEDVLFRVEQVPVNNTNPEITSLPPTRIEAGNDFEYDPTIVELDGDDLKFDLPLAPAGMVVNPQTGAIRWTPQTNQVGIQNVLLRVRDDFGGFDLQYFEVEVLEPNSAPVITSVAPTGPAGVGLPYQYDVNALDANGDTIEYSLVESPAGMTINPATGLLNWTPTADDVGVVDIVVRAADGRGLSSDQAFTLSVELNPENAVPEFTTEPPTSVRLGDRYLYRIGILDVNGDPLTLEFVDGPEGMSFDSDNQLLDWEPTAGQLGTQSVTLRLSDGRGGIAEQSFGIEVETQPVNFPPQITTPPVTVAIADQPYQFDADAVDANNDPLVWTLEQAPVGMTVDPLTGVVNWNPTSEEIGEHQVILQVIDPQGAFSQVVYTLRVRAVNSPPVVLSTPPTIAAVGASYLYQVGAEDADQDRLTFALLSGPAGMSINADTGVVEWSPVAGQEGAADVTIRVSDPLGAFADQSYTIQVGDGSDNRLPVITSTPGFFATLDQVYEYQVEATDPDGDPLVFEFLNGPDGVSLDANSGLLTFTPEVDDLGTNIIQLAARDPSGGGSLQTFSLTVLEENNAPEISSTPPTELASGQPFRYDVLATDADGDFLTYSLIEGPDGMVIDGVGRMFWIPGSDQIGDNDVRIRVSDPQGGFAEQAFSVAVAADTTAPLVAILLSDNPVDVGSIVDIQVSSVDNVGVESLLLTIDGVAVPLDADGRARVELDTVGSVTAVATATDAAGNQGTDEIEIFVADPNDIDGPVISIASPSDGGAITAPTDVIGTVIDDTLVSYTLYLGDFKTRSFNEIGTGDANVDNDVLGMIDPTLLPNNSYILRLEAIDAGGNLSVIEQQVEVTGELKLGNFRQSFTDLVVPVSGIPIQVTRVYDSLRANREGEFGFGWNLEYRDTNLTVSLPSTGLESSGIFPAFRPGVKVYVNLPGQERMGFTFAPEISGLPGGLVLARPRFIADPGVNSTMSVANRGYLTVNQFGELYAGGAIPYNPASPDFGGGFTVTTRDGIKYNIDGMSGLLNTVVDRNGNTITFDNSGISSDAGRVVFERDSQGRVVSIFDLAGQKIEYRYSDAGDLATVIDREGIEVSFGYNEDVAHYLESIIDPLGREGARMEYGDDGRLNTIRNVRGGEVELIFDPDNFVLEQRDPLGGISLLEYDEFGNVVSITDPAGNQTFQQFDGNGNLTAITDSLGNTTTYERNARGDVIAEIDALGNVTQIARDNFGNATSLSDPLGNTLTLEYDAAGNLTHRTDAEGNVTELSYDSRGNVVAATDENGSTETMEYDSFGNVIKVTDRRGFERINTYDANGMNTGNLVFVENEDGELVEYSVQMQLDANGNVINMIGVDGSSVQTEYDELGRPISYVDQLGRQYTMSGNDTPTPELVTGPGGERLEYQYDLADRTTAIENQNGFVETYQYNDLGNLTKRILPDDTPEDLSDNAFMEFEYDALQRVIAIIDANGNRSEIEYDEVGNRILERDPLGNEVKREYDQARRLVRLEDQLGRVTKYQYDENGQLVESLLPNGLVISFQYDSVGNVIRQTDSRGVVNSYTYDQDNNLIEVVDGNGHRTVYAYDRFGNLISQIDPNGNATTFEYDLAGQRTAIERPLGQRATFTYTDDFKLASETSFDGRTHLFIYDDAGRLVRADYADGRSFSAEYDTLGNIVKSTDSRGGHYFRLRCRKSTG